MSNVGDITKFPHQLNFNKNLRKREIFARKIINKLIGDNSADDFYKVTAFGLSNQCFMQATECFMYGQFDGCMVMLRNAIDSALFFTYCYEAQPQKGKKIITSYFPCPSYKKYAHDGKNWEWNSGIKESIDILDLQKRIKLKNCKNCIDEIRNIRDKGNFSAHLAQRQVKEVVKRLKQSKIAKIKSVATEQETLKYIVYTAFYLKQIREAYFVKFLNE